MLGESQLLQNAHPTGEKGLTVVTEDDNVVRNIVEFGSVLDLDVLYSIVEFNWVFFNI